MVEKPAQTNAWRTLDRRLIHDRSPFVRIYDDDVQLPDGRIIHNFVRVEVPDFVVIFTLTADNKVTLVRQYRQAVGDFTLELPAGHIDPGEEPLEAAQRELREETGFVAAEWTSLGSFVMDANRHCGWGHMYLAVSAAPSTTPDSGDLGEQQLVLLPLDEVRQRWQNGEFINAATSLCMGLALCRV